MVLSNACTYGILATLYIAKEERGYIPIREISDELGISFHFLTKILQKLTAKGYLYSLKGPKGGIKLLKDKNTVTLYDIVVTIDGSEIFTECVLGLPGCGHEEPCPIHDYWSPTREKLKEVFSKKTLAETSKGINEMKYRLRIDSV